MNKKKRRYNLIITEKTAGFTNYKFKSHGGIVGILFLLISFVPDLQIDFLTALILTPIVIILWDLITLGLFHLMIYFKNRQINKKSNEMREN